MRPAAFRTAVLRPLNFLVRNAHALIRTPRRRAALRQFERISLAPGDVAIDCGANVGDVTARLAKRGARVYAFEPGPDAFAVLQRRFAGNKRVICRPLAVSDHSGPTRLYLHRRHRPGELGHSTAASLIPTKHNVDPDCSVAVEQMDLAAFILALEARVRILKLDIEGGEATVLNHLIDSGAIQQIDYVFCETHEYKIPGLAGRCRRLRRRLDREGITHVNLNWY